MARCKAIGPRSTGSLDACCVTEAISASLLEVLGTTVGASLPLMAAGLDSVGATEFTNMLT